jgi:hypothetical protein
MGIGAGLDVDGNKQQVQIAARAEGLRAHEGNKAA